MRNFLKKYPLIFAATGLVSIVLIINVIPKYLLSAFNLGALQFGVREVTAAILVMLVYLIFAGPRDFRFSAKGLKYGFSVMFYLFIILFAIGALSIIRIILALVKPEAVSATLLSLLNILLVGLTVGIVEEFSFRGMIFSGLASFFGKNRKGVLLAAIISGALFGFIHVGADVLTGGVTDGWGWAQVAGKTIQAGLIGFVFAIIYFKTRNIWTVIVLHSLNDFLVFLMDATEGLNAPQYVRSGEETTAINLVGPFSVLAYCAFIALTVPLVIRTLRELNKEEEPFILPMDDDFIPRDIQFARKKKQKTEQK